MTKKTARKIVKGITDKIECNTADIDDWAEFWGFTREEYEEFLDMPLKSLEQQPCEDKIIEWKKDFKEYVNSLSIPRDDYKGIMEYIDELPVTSQQPCYNPDEWCKTCKEYNHDKHCCPRYNKVIRNAVEEIKETNIRTAEWVLLDECSNSGYYCSECHKKLVKEGWSGTVKKIKYCPNCGCRMVKSQESGDEE